MPIPTSTVTLILPTLSELIDSAVPGEDGSMIVSADQISTLEAWRNINAAASVAAVEFWEWAIANAPQELVMNMARTGLVV